LLINVGGNHASGGADMDLALMSGVLKPDKKKPDRKKVYGEPGLIQRFLGEGKPVIQILNVKKLYAAYGVYFDQNGELTSGAEKVYKWKRLSPLITVLPVLGMILLLGIFRYSRIDKRRG
jgi:hypothetical protein